MGLSATMIMVFPYNTHLLFPSNSMFVGERSEGLNGTGQMPRLQDSLCDDYQNFI